MMDYSILNREATIWGGIFWNNNTERRLKDKRCLEQYGYKVYSQNDEDGIIQEIFNRIGTTNKTFIEFGVQDGLESNGHYLLFKNWKGLWIDGSQKYIDDIRAKFMPVIQNGQLSCICSFITKDNINKLISNAGFSGEIDMLSVDIDGNDWYVWNAIDIISPRVVVIEYNGKFPPDCEWKMAYNENHVWDGSDWHGSSLKSLELLGVEKGYQLVGTNINGTNAFFVKKELAKDLFYLPAKSEELYNPMRLNIVHKSGHKSKYCLASQKEGLGRLNYGPYNIVVPISGFDVEEKYGETGKTFRWIDSTTSQLVARHEVGKSRIEIPYFISEAAINKTNTQCTLTIKIDDLISKVYIEKPKGKIELFIPKNKECVNITIISPQLWRPCEFFPGTSDMRTLGIGIFFDDIVFEEKNSNMEKEHEKNS